MWQMDFLANVNLVNNKKQTNFESSILSGSNIVKRKHLDIFIP